MARVDHDSGKLFRVGVAITRIKTSLQLIVSGSWAAFRNCSGGKQSMEFNNRKNFNSQIPTD